MHSIIILLSPLLSHMKTSLHLIDLSLFSLGLGPQDVGIKVNSRKILAEIVALAGVPPEKFAATCVLIDKLEKVPLETLENDFLSLGLSMESVRSIVQHLTHRDVAYFESLLGKASPGVSDMIRLYSLADSYGFSDWLVFDPTVVRGLAYYTGIVFEGFDRKGEFRAICGGGRYDSLLETFGDDRIPAVGFGFGDAVIVELLKSKGLMPNFPQGNMQIVAYTMSEDLRAQACKVVATLRSAGFTVDLILEKKKPKWAFQHADRQQAAIVVMFAEEELAKGQVVVKRMVDGQQSEVDVNNLVDFITSIITK
jgi:histidyl-tRNA synthetase